MSPHTCGENGKLSICLCVYMFIWYVRILYMNSALFVRRMQYFHIHVASRSCSRDETRKTERLNSQGNQCNKDLKNGEEKRGTISKTVTDYLTACFMTLPPTENRPSISVRVVIACENLNQRGLRDSIK